MAVQITPDDIGSQFINRQGDVVQILNVDEDWQLNGHHPDNAVGFQIITASPTQESGWGHLPGMRSTCCLDGLYVDDTQCPLDIVEPLDFKECPY